LRSRGTVLIADWCDIGLIDYQSVTKGDEKEPVKTDPITQNIVATFYSHT